MATYEFTAILDRVIGNDDYDLLFDAGLDDSSPGVENGTGYLMVTREAESLSAAIVGVVVEIERAGFVVVGVRDEDLVSLKTIAGRLGRSYESMRLLAAGKRGPGGFPRPVSADGWALYSWAGVAKWFAHHKFGDAVAVDTNHLALAAADHLLQARALVDATTMAELSALTAA